MLEQVEKEALITEIGSGAAKKVEAIINSHNEKMASIIEEAKKNKGVSEEDLKLIKESQAEVAEKMEKVAKAQGKALADLQSAINVAGAVKGESIAELLSKQNEQLKEVYRKGQGTVQFEIFQNSKGETFMRPHDAAKAAYSHGTIDDIDNGANVASIAQALDAASILRMGADAEIITQYRNTPYIFDLCNTITTSNKFAIWMNELDKEGASAEVAEGATKPLSQYFYQLKSDTYKKEATLLTFTEEFDMDFTRLQQQAVVSAKTDLTNRINSAIQTRLFAAATAYNTGATFAPLILDATPNDFDAIAAMAAQADSTTFGSARSNAALMSAYKKYAMGLIKDTQKNYLNAPSVINSLAMVGNAGVGADDVIVGDFKQYNILLRGGLIMKVGYNGTNFAENKFSVVLEQYYFDYISSIRAKALVKGTTFATVKAAITTA